MVEQCRSRPCRGLPRTLPAQGMGESDHQHTRELTETWIVFELCTEGSLQVWFTALLREVSEAFLHF